MYVGTVHRARRGAFEVHAFAVIAAAVARTLELVFAGFPVRRAAKMRAAGINHKEPVGSAVHPDAVFLLKLGVHAESVVRGIADFENRGRFEERSWEEEAEEGDEPCTKKGRNSAPDQAAASFIGFRRLRADCRNAARCRGLGRADRRSADASVPGAEDFGASGLGLTVSDSRPAMQNLLE